MAILWQWQWQWQWQEQRQLWQQQQQRLHHHQMDTRISENTLANEKTTRPLSPA